MRSPYSAPSHHAAPGPGGPWRNRHPLTTAVAMAAIVCLTFAAIRVVMWVGGLVGGVPRPESILRFSTAALWVVAGVGLFRQRAVGAWSVLVATFVTVGYNTLQIASTAGFAAVLRTPQWLAPTLFFNGVPLVLSLYVIVAQRALLLEPLTRDDD